MTEKPISVMHVMGRMMGGGLEATIMNHYRFIDRERVRFDFLVQENSDSVPTELIEGNGGRIYTIPSYKKLPSYMETCERVFREARPDIVHSNMNALSVFPLAAAKHAGVPVRIAHSHSTANRNELMRTAAKSVLRPFSKVYPTHLAACSVVAGEWLFGKKAVKEGKVHYIQNAIDLDRFSFSSSKRNELRHEIGAKEGQFVIGQVGRFCSQKNQMFSVEIFNDFLRINPKALLVFIGTGDALDEVKKKVHNLGIEGSVRFMGVRDDVSDWYSAFDALLFPSLYEGLGMVAVEAQEAALPVLASDHVPDEAFVVSDLITVMPLRVGSHEWARALRRIENTFDSRFRQNTKAALTAAGYDIHDSARRLTSWYETILSDTPAKESELVQ